MELTNELRALLDKLRAPDLRFGTIETKIELSREPYHPDRRTELRQIEPVAPDIIVSKNEKCDERHDNDAGEVKPGGDSHFRFPCRSLFR